MGTPVCGMLAYTKYGPAVRAGGQFFWPSRSGHCAFAALHRLLGAAADFGADRSLRDE